MKKLLFILTMSGLVAACGPSQDSTTEIQVPPPDAPAEPMDETPAAPETATVPQPGMTVSYDSLKWRVDHNKRIEYDYFNGMEDIKSPLLEIYPQKELDHYLVIRSAGGHGTDVLPYYMSCFSKETGLMTGFVPVGVEAEGVEPFKINWTTDTSFTTTDYAFELVEDPESGAYMQGELKDSTVVTFMILPDGKIMSYDPEI